MTLFLIAIIIFNSAVIVWLWKANRQSKRAHLKKTELLEAIILELLNNHKNKKEKIQLAEEIKEQLRATKNKLNVDILSLQYEFLEALTRNKLIE